MDRPNTWKRNTITSEILKQSHFSHSPNCKLTMNFVDRVATNNWLVNVSENGSIVEAIKGLQKKMKQVASAIDDEDNESLGEKPQASVARGVKREGEQVAYRYIPAKERVYDNSDVERDEQGNPIRWYFVLRGKFNVRTNTFFNGYVQQDEYRSQQGCWKFVGLSSVHLKKLMLWITEESERVREQNATFYNEQGKFSKQWYTIKDDHTGKAWIVATLEEANLLTERKMRSKDWYSNYTEAKIAATGYQLQPYD